MFKNIAILTAVCLSTSLFAEPKGIERLMQGNKRFTQDALEHPNRTSERREALTSTQEPFAAILSCADSRVAPEIIFDQGVGDLFVVRVAGNVVGPLEMESMEFATTGLHASTILVLGHEKCGAVNAVIQGQIADISAIAKIIKPSVKAVESKDDKDILRAAIKANAVQMKKDLLKSPRIQKLVSDGKLEVYAGYYNLASGAVELLD